MCCWWLGSSHQAVHVHAFTRVDLCRNHSVTPLGPVSSCRAGVPAAHTVGVPHK